jgi:hypothetical protein
VRERPAAGVGRSGGSALSPLRATILPPLCSTLVDLLFCHRESGQTAA